MNNMNIKLAFFDLDYTLSESMYLDENGNIIDGMHTKERLEYCRKYGEDSYTYCKPVYKIADYARAYKNRGVEIYVLGAIKDDIEIPGKIKFINTYYSDLFDKDHIIFVKGFGKTKAEKIKSIAEEKNIPLDECELIEDDYQAILGAIDLGIHGTHVTKVFNNFDYNRINQYSPYESDVYDNCKKSIPIFGERISIPIKDPDLQNLFLASQELEDHLLEIRNKYFKRANKEQDEKMINDIEKGYNK